MEVHRVQGDELGGREESIKVDLPHGTGDAIAACRGTNEPAVSREGVIDVFALADGARFVVVWKFWVTSLNGEGNGKKMSPLFLHASKRV